MSPWASRRLSAVPQTAHVQMQIAEAIRTLAADDEEHQLRRRIEAAAIRRDCELIAQDLRSVCREWLSLVQADLRKYSQDQPRVPAGNPDGGEWTKESEGRSVPDSRVISDATPDNLWTLGARYAANDTPGIGHNQGPPLEEPPGIPTERPNTAQGLNFFLKAAAKWLAKATLAGAEEPVAIFLASLELQRWLDPKSQALIDSYLDPPKTLEELQQNALTARSGYDIHHIAEQTAARKDGFPESLVNGPENLVSVPTQKHWQITGWYLMRNPEFGGLSPRAYLRGKSWEERQRVGYLALIRFGVLKP